MQDYVNITYCYYSIPSGKFGHIAQGGYNTIRFCHFQGSGSGTGLRAMRLALVSVLVNQLSFDGLTNAIDIVDGVSVVLYADSQYVTNCTGAIRTESTTTVYLQNIRSPYGVSVTGLRTSTQSISSNTTLTTEDTACFANATSGAITITLPTAVGYSGKLIVIKKVDSSSNAVIVQAAGSETIDGQNSRSLTTQYETLRIISDGTNWMIV